MSEIFDPRLLLQLIGLGVTAIVIVQANRYNIQSLQKNVAELKDQFKELAESHQAIQVRVAVLEEWRKHKDACLKCPPPPPET